MNFYEIDRLVQNEVLIRRFVEAITGQEPTNPTPGIQGVTPEDPIWNYHRGRGVLRPKDPINQYKGNESASSLNIVWITGMWNGRLPGAAYWTLAGARYSELLKPLGYNVRTVSTLSDMKTAGLGRLVRHIPIQAVKDLHSRWAGAHVAKNQEKVTSELGDAVPDLIIGSSQGGAIALSIANRYKDTPMFLISPAWKIFNVTPTYINPESIIIHGKNDVEVPFTDSQELAKQFNIELIATEDGHVLKQGMSSLISRLHSLTPSLVRAKRERDAIPQEHVLSYRVNLWVA